MQCPDNSIVRFHTIPVGDESPYYDGIHFASLKCWCSPLQDPEDPQLVIHHAHDMREVRERQGIIDSEGWITIGQILVDDSDD
jgi:hypothetical protein